MLPLGTHVEKCQHLYFANFLIHNHHIGVASIVITFILRRKTKVQGEMVVSQKSGSRYVFRSDAAKSTPSWSPILAPAWNDTYCACNIWTLESNGVTRWAGKYLAGAATYCEHIFRRRFCIWAYAYLLLFLGGAPTLSWDTFWTQGVGGTPCCWVTVPVNVSKPPAPRLWIVNVVLATNNWQVYAKSHTFPARTGI